MELPNLIGEEATNVLFGPNSQDTCGIDTPNGGLVITRMTKVVKTLCIVKFSWLVSLKHK
jgi:hypothetical protein